LFKQLERLLSMRQKKQTFPELCAVGELAEPEFTEGKPFKNRLRQAQATNLSYILVKDYKTAVNS